MIQRILRQSQYAKRDLAMTYHTFAIRNHSRPCLILQQEILTGRFKRLLWHKVLRGPLFRSKIEALAWVLDLGGWPGNGLSIARRWPGSYGAFCRDRRQ